MKGWKNNQSVANAMGKKGSHSFTDEALNELCTPA
jgi:hypothetical protein